jgi:hypothetical protein
MSFLVQNIHFLGGSPTRLGGSVTKSPANAVGLPPEFVFFTINWFAGM